MKGKRGGRPFRGEDSYVAERITRGMVQPFLQQKGYTNIEDMRVRFGNNESQLVSAIDQTGQPVKMHVQSCWRRDRGNERQRLYSAAQLMAAVKDGDRKAPSGTSLREVKVMERRTRFSFSATARSSCMQQGSR